MIKNFSDCVGRQDGGNDSHKALLPQLPGPQTQVMVGLAIVADVKIQPLQSSHINMTTFF
jgi:hypothetical protein